MMPPPDNDAPGPLRILFGFAVLIGLLLGLHFLSGGTFTLN